MKYHISLSLCLPDLLNFKLNLVFRPPVFKNILYVAVPKLWVASDVGMNRIAIMSSKIYC